MERVSEQVQELSEGQEHWGLFGNFSGVRNFGPGGPVSRKSRHGTHERAPRVLAAGCLLPATCVEFLEKGEKRTYSEMGGLNSHYLLLAHATA